MRSVFLFLILLLLCPFSRAQSLAFANRLIEYYPAPGQHINDPITGTPSASLYIINHVGNPLSLGAYGGSVVLGFNSSVVNDPGNPYGVDFIIYGNASASHSEPGIVKVMKDENKNGIPDETWYEIAGSAHYTHDFSGEYSINYLNPGYSSAADVQWTDNSGNSGKVFKNSFHTQPYYPLNEYFPGISSESMNFSGSKLKGNVQTQNGMYVSLPYSFGYADNIPLNNGEIKGIPDNPYTGASIEGDGGDAIDISWAIDSTGNYVELPEVDFIMIYTAVNESAGWLGEISTDIRGVADVIPDKDISGLLKMIIPSELPAKLSLSYSLLLNGRVFISGRPSTDEKIIWESLNPSIIQVTDNVLTAVAIGEAEIKGRLFSDPSVFIKEKISVVIPNSLLLEDQSLLLQEGEKLPIKYTVLDNYGDLVSGLIPSIIIENKSIAEIVEVNEGQFSLIGKTAGVSLISFAFPNFPQLAKTFEVRVIRNIDRINVFFSLSAGKKNIIPVKGFTVGKADILSFTDRHQKSFRNDESYITLADAIASALSIEGFGKEGKSLAFRQDEFGGDGLYVWQIGYDWEYKYGWGGSLSDEIHAKTWFAIVNDNLFASGFDTIEIVSGDRISLLHNDDIRNPWSFVRIIPEKDKIMIGETVNFHSEQLDIYPGNNFDFVISGPFPAANSPVLVDPALINNESDQFSSFSGEFKLVFNQAGHHPVAIENSEPVLLEVLNPLSIVETEQIDVYPNPCSDLLKVFIPSNEYREIKLFAVDGKLAVQKTIENGVLLMELNMINLESGIYILELISKGKILQQKICKL